jgi:hypothetical protein
MPLERLALQTRCYRPSGRLLDGKDEMGTEINCFGLRKDYDSLRELAEKGGANKKYRPILLYSDTDGVN